MRIYWNNGLVLENGSKLAIDCNGAASIITHAHADHASFKATGSVLSSEETLSLVEANYRKPKEAKPLKFKEKASIEGFDISLHNSGHILGSAQVLLEDSERIAITSDFKLQDSLILKGAEPLSCDTLIIETTFGLAEYNFPNRTELYEEFASWIKKQLALNRFVVLAGYSIGKAQELTAFVNEYLGIAPIVHERIYQNNKVYEKHNVKLGTYYKLDHNLNDSDILIMPPSLCNAHLLQAIGFSVGRRVASAKASGWNYRGCFDIVFQLSDHADFNQLIEYVKLAEPKLVLTMHGFAKEFASYVRRRLKIPARALHKEPQQLFLEEFD
jgi:Cft2 family RNA processing exonuclease